MNIVLINGGRGATNIINKLILNKNLKISSIVNAYDDGKSTGTIRNFFNILGPSDIRKVQSLFLDKKNKNYYIYKKFFEYRFSRNISNLEAKNEIYKVLNLKKNNIINLNKISKLKSKKIHFFLQLFAQKTLIIENKKKLLFNFNDCSIINCLYAGAIIHFKNDINSAISEISEIFDIKHKVYVNSKSNRYLYALRSNGEILSSEREIVEIRSNKNIDEIYLFKKKIPIKNIENQTIKNKKIFLSSHHNAPIINKQIISVLEKANLIIFCAGTQHSSLYPTYLTKGFLKNIKLSKAKKIFISNIGADYETPFYKASDYVNGAIKYLNKYNKINLNIFDLIFINKPYKNNRNYVSLDLENLSKIKTKIIIDDFEHKLKNGQHDANKIFKYLF